MARFRGAGRRTAWHGCDCLPVREADPAAAVPADARRWRARDRDTPACSADSELGGRERSDRVLRWPGGNVRTDAGDAQTRFDPVSYTHLRAHETRHDLVCRLLL